jgi:prepilin-type N-terminal cleavage/methylation domain-containing protein
MLFKKERGFTLIEIMIVVAIIAILAAIAIPRFRAMQETAREAKTKDNLSALRSAVMIYYGNNEGRWPDDLSASAFTEYIAAIPPAKATPLGDSTNVVSVTDVPNAYGVGWAYCSALGTYEGQIWCNSNSIDSKGASFTTY